MSTCMYYLSTDQQVRKHYIYALKFKDTIFYIGYTNQSPAKRLAQHIQEALEPSESEKEMRLIRGCPTPKHQYIIQAHKEGIDIVQEIVAEEPLHVELDELEYINEYKAAGHPLTNDATGIKWQKQIIKDGKIYTLGTSKFTAPPSKEPDYVPDETGYKTVLWESIMKKCAAKRAADAE